MGRRGSGSIYYYFATFQTSCLLIHDLIRNFKIKRSSKFLLYLFNLVTDIWATWGFQTVLILISDKWRVVQVHVILKLKISTTTTNKSKHSVRFPCYVIHMFIKRQFIHDYPQVLFPTVTFLRYSLLMLYCNNILLRLRVVDIVAHLSTLRDFVSSTQFHNFLKK